MAKLDRLLNLVAALSEATVPLTAEEIRERVPGYAGNSQDAFHRSFERDKDDLRELGIPVETVTVEHFEQPRAAYTIVRDRYELPDPGLDPTELTALHLAATTVQIEGLSSALTEAGMRKLGGVPLAGAPADEDGASPQGVGGISAAVPMPAALMELFTAVLERREVQFPYGDALRRVQPHRLQFERGRWYLSGHDLDRSAERAFRLDRVDGDVIVGDPDAFVRPERTSSLRLRPWELGEDDVTEVLVRVDEAVAQSLLVEDPSLAVERVEQDGSRVLALEVRNQVALRNFVLAMLDSAEVLEPSQVRSDMVSWLGQLANPAEVVS